MTGLKITKRRLPHWSLPGSTYFVTFRVAADDLSLDEIQLVLDHLKAGQEGRYTLIAATVMPDHVHLLICPEEGASLGQTMRGIKGASARKINRGRGTKGRVWQDESWDRIVRDQDELDEKLAYMLNNPVRKGLVADPRQYPGWFLNAD
ncbi:MAG: transposase [Candidatus Zixiibacteriota bacterium]